jgi:hypothetical protein
MDTQERTFIVVIGFIAFGMLFALLYGMATELHDIRMELWNIKREHRVIVEHQHKVTADTIVVYKEREVKSKSDANNRKHKHNQY